MKQFPQYHNHIKDYINALSNSHYRNMSRGAENAYHGYTVAHKDQWRRRVNRHRPCNKHKK